MFSTKFQLKLAREGVSHGGLGLLVSILGAISSTFEYSLNSLMIIKYFNIPGGLPII